MKIQVIHDDITEEHWNVDYLEQSVAVKPKMKYINNSNTDIILNKFDLEVDEIFSIIKHGLGNITISNVDILSNDLQLDQYILNDNNIAVSFRVIDTSEPTGQLTWNNSPLTWATQPLTYI